MGTRSSLKSETMEHILFECEKCNAERKNLVRKLRNIRVLQVGLV